MLVVYLIAKVSEGVLTLIHLCLRKEQKGFGKFDKLKSYAADIQEKWDAPMVKQYLSLGCQGNLSCSLASSFLALKNRHKVECSCIS